jgi:hypothetical protein
VSVKLPVRVEACALARDGARLAAASTTAVRVDLIVGFSGIALDRK